MQVEKEGPAVAAAEFFVGRLPVAAKHRLSGGPVPPRSGRSAALGWRNRNLRPARTRRRGSEMADVLRYVRPLPPELHYMRGPGPKRAAGLWSAKPGAHVDGLDGRRSACSPEKLARLDQFANRELP